MDLPTKPGARSTRLAVPLGPQLINCRTAGRSASHLPLGHLGGPQISRLHPSGAQLFPRTVTPLSGASSRGSLQNDRASEVARSACVQPLGFSDSYRSPMHSD